jgi:hypothetical protein
MEDRGEKAIAPAKPEGAVMELAFGSGAWTESLITHPVDSIQAVPRGLFWGEARRSDA